MVDVSWDNGVLKLQISLKLGAAKQDAEWVRADEVEVVE